MNGCNGMMRNVKESNAAAEPGHALWRHRRRPASRMFTGNRGIIHDPATRTLLGKRWSSPAWLTCVCEFRGRRRKVMGGRSWTELFFLDEATAFAAGHRPCFFCRRDDALKFRAAWEQGNDVADVLARDVDAVLHRERLARRQETIARAAGAAGKIARRHDGFERRGELPDRAGTGAAMVAGGLSGAVSAAQGRQAADTAFDGSCVQRGISAGAASECEARSLPHKGPQAGRGRAEIAEIAPTPASAAPTSRRRRAPSAWLRRCRGASAPCRNWWSR